MSVIDRSTAQTALLNWPPLITACLLWAAWLWLFRPIFAYLRLIFTQTDFRTNQIALTLVLALILYQLHEKRALASGWQLNSPTWRPLMVGVALGSAVGFLLAERFLAINTLSATLFALGSYGLLGLWVASQRWQRGLPAALLMVGTLPFGHHLQTFVGYPLRIATAALVRDGLSAAGIGHVGIDTILILENGVSHIDIPCSGVQSLWTGVMFLVAATWIEDKKIGARWLGVALTLMLLLFISNFVRVAVLTVTGASLGWTLLAEMLHVPLGVCGFVLACGASLWLLRRLPANAPPGSWRPAAGTTHNALWKARLSWPSPIAPAAHALLLAAVFVGLSLLYVRRPNVGLSQSAPGWYFGPTVQTEAFPLKPDEAAWLTKDGAESAERLTFKSGDLSGSMILITSSTWRAHHRPERCFEVYGLAIDNSATHLVDQTFPIRLVSLGDGTYTANYWFQSAEVTTDDYATRIWDDVQRERNRWVLVSMVFDGDVDVNSAEVKQFHRTIHAAVAARLDA